jgi:phosphoserine aminotransferase
MPRIHNFSAGPAVLPIPVLEEAKSALLDFKGCGMGIMEISHRSKEFEDVLTAAVERIKRVLKISSNYKVLFCTGGATQQFSAISMNLLQKDHVGGYILSGVWSEKAEEEARKFGATKVLASAKEGGYREIPPFPSLETLASVCNEKQLGYVHITSNNTIYGTQFHQDPDTGTIPLLADTSSDLLHRPVDVTKYGLLYASAQKNLGPAGVTIVIIREDLLERVPSTLPLMTSYRTYSESNSLYNTPPTFPIYIVERVLAWIEAEGGLTSIHERNQRKAQSIYGEIDRSEFYQGHADVKHRSLMNVTFTLQDKKLDDSFNKKALAEGLSGLKGHRSVGGFRASMYNALPEASSQALAQFMKEFERTNG